MYGIDRWIRYSTTSTNAYKSNSTAFNAKLKLKLTDLSGRLSKLITKAGVHLAIELTHMLRSRGTAIVIL
jgi:hypothetical protein